MDGMVAILDAISRMDEDEQERLCRWLNSGSGAGKTLVRIIVEKHMPWFLLDTGFFQNAKIRELDFCEQRHFISVLAMKRDGKLDKPYRSMRALDSLVQHTLEISAVGSRRLKV